MSYFPKDIHGDLIDFDETEGKYDERGYADCYERENNFIIEKMTILFHNNGKRYYTHRLLVLNEDNGEISGNNVFGVIRSVWIEEPLDIKYLNININLGLDILNLIKSYT